jgi:hypothetical protein
MNTADNSAPEYPPFNVPHASGTLYDSTPGAIVGALDDLLSEKLHQLSALLKVPYAGSGETFRNLNPSIQDNYMWCCSALVDECLQLTMQVSARPTPGVLQK